MIESPKITVVSALVKLSADGTTGVETVLLTTLVFPFPFSLDGEIESKIISGFVPVLYMEISMALPVAW